MSENLMNSTQKMEEITIKFGKGLVSKPFTARSGTECVSIKIPNVDPSDHRPWASIITAAGSVHENKYGKGLWMKVPANGKMKVYRSEIIGKTDDGKNQYRQTTQMVENKTIKSMLESYKTHSMESEKPSLREALKQPSIPGNRTMRTNSMER